MNPLIDSISCLLKFKLKKIIIQCYVLVGCVISFMSGFTICKLHLIFEVTEFEKNSLSDGQIIVFTGSFFSECMFLCKKKAYFYLKYSCNKITTTWIQIEMAFSQILAIRWWFNYVTSVFLIILYTPIFLL